LASEESVREKIAKLLNLTSSDNDGEALNAIRIANQILKKNGLDWPTLIEEDKPIRYQAKEPPVTPAPMKVHIVDEDDVHEIIDFIKDNAWEDFDYSFVDSIEKNFEEYHRLTRRQMNALKKVYSSVKQHAERIQA
jgi:hypothetical protein